MREIMFIRTSDFLTMPTRKLNNTLTYVHTPLAISIHCNQVGIQYFISNLIAYEYIKTIFVGVLQQAAHP